MAKRRRRADPDPELLAAELPVSIPWEDLTEYRYELDLIERWTPELPAATMDISN